jgi:TetR/AcrR family transcriptional regulator, tetracycline repressor protein
VKRSFPSSRVSRGVVRKHLRSFRSMGYEDARCAAARGTVTRTAKLTPLAGGQSNEVRRQCQIGSEDGVHNGDGGIVKMRLSRDLICEAALEAIDEVGLEAVSMRMVAGSLGVKASSLYHHFKSRDELMTGVAEFLYRQLGQPPSGEGWADQVKGTFGQLRDFMQVHPNAAPLLVRDLARSSVANKRANVLLGLVCRAGVDHATSADLLSNLVALLVGHTLLALWVQEETSGGADGPYGESNDISGVWARKLFPEEAPDLSDSEISPLADCWSGEPLRAGACVSTLKRTVAGSVVASVGCGSSEQPSADSAFSAGLDALVSGFASNGDSVLVRET